MSRRFRLSDLPPKARAQARAQGAKRFDLADRFRELLRIDPRFADLEFVREHSGEPEIGGPWDLAWLPGKLAVEIHGGTLSKAGQWRSHAGPKGLQRDARKAALGQIHGWIVLAFTDLDLRDRPGECLDLVDRAAKLRKTQCHGS